MMVRRGCVQDNEISGDLSKVNLKSHSLDRMNIWGLLNSKREKTVQQAIFQSSLISLA